MALIHAARVLLLLYQMKAMTALLPSVSKVPVCSMDKAHLGVVVCQEAFEKSMTDNGFQIQQSPKRVGCCLSQNLGHCVKFAYDTSHCNGSIVREELQEKQKDAQRFINSKTRYLGNLNCEPRHSFMEHCEHIVDEYKKAMDEIMKINGQFKLCASITLLTLTLSVVWRVGIKVT